MVRAYAAIGRRRHGLDAFARFVLIDAVGVSESLKTVSQPLERDLVISFDRLIDDIAAGRRGPQVASIFPASPHACATPSTRMHWRSVCQRTRRNPNRKRRARLRKTRPRQFSMIRRCDAC